MKQVEPEGPVTKIFKVKNFKKAIQNFKTEQLI